MLVTLGSGETVSASASQTFQYACNSVQQIYLRTEEAGATTSMEIFCTVQIGNDVVVNDIAFQGLGLLSWVTGGGSKGEGTQAIKIDLGSHILDGEENLYVTLRNAGSADVTAVDVAAIVNEGGVYQPLKYTNYADSVFTDTNTLSIYAWANADMDEDTSVFTVRNQSYSSAPQVQSGCNVSFCNSWTYHAGTSDWKQIAIMAQNQVPLNTSVNYSSAIIDGVICVSAMDKTLSKAGASRAQGKAVLSAMTSAERKAL